LNPGVNAEISTGLTPDFHGVNAEISTALTPLFLGVNAGIGDVPGRQISPATRLSNMLLISSDLMESHSISSDISFRAMRYLIP
jgi:hypothetical protein